jgi:C-terminal processing protease CtpA/Prc
MVAQSDACAIELQQAGLLGWMRDWYFWSSAIPESFRFPESVVTPGVSNVGVMLAGFEALRFRGDDKSPADRWSYVGDTARTSLYFDEGATLGYGVSVAGQDSDPLPLRIRWIEPSSPAARQGLGRGDVVETIQGRSAQSWKEARDFSPLVANQAGDELVLEVRRGELLQRVVLRAEVYPITSVLDFNADTLWSSANGNRAGYVFLKDFIDSARQPLASVLRELQQAKVKDLVLDLRYNGGGRVDFTRQVASAMVGERLYGEVFTRLVFNNRHPEAEATYLFADSYPLAPLGLERLVVLTGPRTCSASELLINGLKARVPSLSVNVIGEKSCGKPYGFIPRAACGLTYNAVNFTTLNARGEANYANGMLPDCQVRDQYQDQLGSRKEALLSAARQWLDQGACSVALPGVGPSVLRTDPGSQGKESPAVRPFTRLVADGDAPTGLVGGESAPRAPGGRR